MISKMKLDDSFPIRQFYIEGFGTFIRLDHKQNGGGIMLLSKEAIPIKLLSSEIAPMKSFYVEINLRKKKWLLNCSYNPGNTNISMHTSALRKSSNIFSTQYKHFVTLEDFMCKWIIIV